MRDTIIDIRDNLRQGLYTNEAAVSRGVVLRVLNDLSWPIFEPTIVAPEFNLSGTRVDYALCHPSLKPLVLLEVKQVGPAVDAARQLFGYAVHHGVPMAILSTGQEWHFFLPGERGDYEERRVYMLDLLERDPDETVARLHRYLAYQRVCSGQAIEAAKADYRDVAREREIRRVLPEAWDKLICEGDELLIELIAEKVESICGYKPAPDTVAKFLAGSSQALPLVTLTKIQATPFPPQRSSQAVPDESIRGTSRSMALVFHGKVYSASTGREVLLKCLQLMAEYDPNFLERFSARTASQKKRRVIARSKLDLFPSSPHLAEIPSNSRELTPGSGWWVDLHMSRPSMERVIQTACEVAGLKFGTDVKVNMG